jgi:hypothetical protein
MICPSCKKDQKVTEQNYGALYTCGSCKAVYFINFDGQPEYGEASSEEYEAAQNEQRAAAAAPEAPANVFPDDGLEPLVSVTESVDGMLDATPESGSYLSEIIAGAGGPSAGVNPFEAYNAVPETPVAQPKAQKSPAQSQHSSAQTQKSSGGGGLFADIAQEISDFANTDSQLAGLNYDVTITGIDTQETKALFKEAIEDSKFAWDATEIMKSLKNGRVQILKMSPAKAYLLAKRIQFLDIERSWKQNVLS